MREFSCDLVEHWARLNRTGSCRSTAIRRYLGVGNGSALGLIFFVHKHPQVIGSWIAAREEAIAAARGLRLEKGDGRIEAALVGA